MKLLRKLSVITLFLGITVCIKFNAIAADPATVFIHDPRFNSSVMEDVIVDFSAVYGFRPNPESSSIGSFASADWTNPAFVENSRNERIAYHDSKEQMYETLLSMYSEGKSDEEIARTLSTMRNDLRIASYKDDPQGLAKMEARNLEKYGNKNGPTPEYLYEFLGSWKAVIASSFKSNSGMDACLGIYDDYFPLYIAFGQITGEETSIVHEVQENETLQSISRKYYDTSDKWSLIYSYNMDKINNADIIHTGDVLIFPII